MRLIDADALMQATCDWGICSDCEDAYKGQNVHANCSEIRLVFLRIINDAPVIDIVRCKECKYGDTGTDEDDTLFWKCLGRHYGGTNPDDFCSYGEREDN